MAEQAQREHIELDNAANKLRTKQKHKMDEKETLSGQITRAEEQKNLLLLALISLWHSFGTIMSLQEATLQR